MPLPWQPPNTIITNRSKSKSRLLTEMGRLRRIKPRLHQWIIQRGSANVASLDPNHATAQEPRDMPTEIRFAAFVREITL